MKPSEKKRLGAGRVAFLARMSAIKEKIDAGHTMAEVYDDYHQQIEISYRQFVNYVNKFIRGKPSTEREKEKPEPLEKREKPIKENDETTEEPTGEQNDDRDDIEGKAASGDFF